MNISSFLGVLFGSIVFYLALAQTTDNLSFFLDLHGLLIVVGGTAAASSISFPIHEVFLLIKVFFLRVLGKKNIDFVGIITEMVELSKKSSISPTALNEVVQSIQHPFLKEGISLLAGGILNEEELHMVLMQRLKTIEKRYFYEANMFRVIGRFPPAFGLLATTLGMIGLLQKIGQPDSQKLIGPAMSVGLIGTLYGIALANLVFIPIAENLTERTFDEMMLRKMIVQGIVLIKKKANPIALREYLLSFVMPKQRHLKKKKTK